MVDPRNLGEVRQVLDQHRDELVRRYNAVGTAIGKADPPADSYVIVVYLRSKNDLPGQPVCIDGVPVKFVVTGVIRPAG